MLINFRLKKYSDFKWSLGLKIVKIDGNDYENRFWHNFLFTNLLELYNSSVILSDSLLIIFQNFTNNNLFQIGLKFMRKRNFPNSLKFFIRFVFQ